MFIARLLIGVALATVVAIVILIRGGWPWVDINLTPMSIVGALIACIFCAFVGGAIFSAGCGVWRKKFSEQFREAEAEMVGEVHFPLFAAIGWIFIARFALVPAGLFVATLGVYVFALTLSSQSASSVSGKVTCYGKAVAPLLSSSVYLIDVSAEIARTARRGVIRENGDFTVHWVRAGKYIISLIEPSKAQEGTFTHSPSEVISVPEEKKVIVVPKIDWVGHPCFRPLDQYPLSPMKLQSLRFFEIGDVLPEISHRQYAERFPKSATRSVAFQVNVQNRLWASKNHTHKVLGRYYGPDGSLVGHLPESEWLIKSHEETAQFSYGWGVKEPGQWPPGTYRVEVLIDGQKFAEGQFTIYEDRYRESSDQRGFIQQAQERLKAAGCDPGSIDGMLGRQTREALRCYQNKHGLPATGELDVTTRKALGLP